jgi:large subunit ribosomal protein L16
MLQPKRTKFRKAHKGRIKGVAKGGFTAVLRRVRPQGARARARDRAPDRGGAPRDHARMKRQGRVWIRIFPDVPVSTKPAEVRMGSGKGAPEYWVCRVKPGRIMFEIDGVPNEIAREALASVRRSCRSRPRSSRASAVAGGLIMAMTKIVDVRGKSADELQEMLVGPAEGAVQPALPAGDRPARGAFAHQAGPARPSRG